MRRPLFQAFSGVAFTLIVLSQTGLEGQTHRPGSVTEIQLHLDRLEALGYSGAVGVMRDGEVLVKRAMGYADRETSTPFTDETGFFIASISKQFTAALILALDDRGLLSTQDHLGVHLDDVPPEMSAVTIHHLLSHTAGLLRLQPPSSEVLVTGEDVLSAGLRAGVEYEPGARFDYSNFGYAFLAALAERVAGRSYEALMREFIFEPAGMHSTSVVTESSVWEGRDLAVGYNGFLPQGNSLLARSFGRELVGPAGIVTTLEDMLRWDEALRGDEVLSQSALERMFTPVLDGYAYGWTVWESQRAGELTAAHDGHIMPEGFNSYYIRLLDSDASVVVFSNRGDVALAERVAWELTDILGGKPAPELPEVGRSDVTPSAGLYVSDGGARVRLLRLGEQYYMEPLNQAAANLFLEEIEQTTAVTRLVERWLAAGDVDPSSPLGITLAAAQAQETRFGKYSGHEVIYTVQEDGFMRTHLRHFLGSDTLFTRLDIVDEEVVAGTDWGAFISGGRGLTPTLAYLGMAPASERSWIAYDFWGDRTVEVSFDGGTLVIRSRGGTVVLHTTGSH